MAGGLLRREPHRRKGTANLFVFVDVQRPWRKVKVTESRTAVDFAACMRELADIHFPKAERIRVVLDNLSTHSAGALYQASEEARRVLRQLEFHHVPKHASWLNMVEIEIGVLAGPMPRSPHRQYRASDRRDHRLGATAQCGRGSHQMDVHNRKGPRQNGPALSQSSGQLRLRVQRVKTTVQRLSGAGSSSCGGV